MDPAKLTSLLNISALVAIMLSMGLQAKVAEVIASARQFRLVLAGVLANYVVVPVITVVLLRLFQAEPLVAAGFLILAVCPGAPAGPPLTVMARGSLPTAIGLMVILGGTSAVVSPLLLSLLLGRLAPDGEMHIDFLAIVQTLIAAQLLPLGVGLGANHFAPQLAQRIVKPLSSLANLLLIGLIAMILVGQFNTLAAIRLRGWFGMGLLLGASFGIGWIGGGSARSTRTAMALTTAVRNAAVGLVIATGSFPGSPAVTAVIAYGLVSLAGAIGLAAILRARGHSVGAEPLDGA